MDVSALAAPAPYVAPPQPDLRPAADAAATRTGSAPLLAIAEPAPAAPVSSQRAEVSRAMLLASRVGDPAPSAPSAAQRSLAPYGTPMLPDTAAAAERRTPAPDSAAPD